MLFNIKLIPATGSLTGCSYLSVEEIKAEFERRGIEDAKPGARAQVTYELSRSDTTVLLKGRVKGALIVECARCLEPFVFHFDTELYQLYIPETKYRQRFGGGEEELELTREDLVLSYYSDDEIDISPLVYEEIILSIPMKPICREDCKGLCPRCGTNLNTGTCLCQKESVDPRWRALKKLQLKNK